MYIIKPHIFSRYPEIIFGLSTKIGLRRLPPFCFNLSYSVGDDLQIVDENRKEFFNAIGLPVHSVAYQKQIHSDIITTANCGGDIGESDAIITDKKNIGLAVSIADCTPIFLYDFKNQVIAAVHSGWRGTEKQILSKTLLKLQQQFNTSPQNLIAYIGPSISQANYEVGNDVTEKFNPKFVVKKNNKFYLDVSGANYFMLLDFGIPTNQIQKSDLCSYEYGELLHSYRRESEKSGRSLGVIAIKG